MLPINTIMEMLKESGINKVIQFRPLPPDSGFHGLQLKEVELRMKVVITEDQYNELKSKIPANIDASVSGVDGTPPDK